jgi:hypothetical protein
MMDQVRACGSCTLCCKVLAVHGVPKPKRQWCQHCSAGKGCAIYDERPQDCRDFHCMYVTNAALGAHWFPAHSKMILCSDPTIPRIEIHVDEGRADAWRKEPYYSEIKAWSRAALAADGQVMICLPDRTIVVLPHKDVDLGKLEETDRILCFETMTASGPMPDVEKVRADDPRLPPARP